MTRFGAPLRPRIARAPLRTLDAQGNESGLTRQGSQALGQVVWVPSGDLSAQLDAVLVCRGADQVDGEVSDDGHVFCAMAFAQTRLVFGEDDVQHPMQLVLYAPMAAHRAGRLLRRKLGRGDGIAGLETAAVGKLGARLDSDDRGGAGQAKPAR